MRATLILASIAAHVVVAGCGLVRDVRSGCVANRALGEARADLGAATPRRQQALAQLDLAYRLRRHDDRFLARLAVPYLAAGDHERALKCYEASARITGERHDLEVGMCYLALDKRDLGVARLEKALAAAIQKHKAGRMSSRAYAGVLNDVGYVLVDADLRLDDAFKWIEEAVRISPTIPAYIDSLGWAYYRRGDDHMAAFHLERAARLAGRDDPEMLWHLGAVHARLRQFRRAESELVRALELDPTNEEARRTLHRLQHELPPPAQV